MDTIQDGSAIANLPIAELEEDLAAFLLPAPVVLLRPLVLLP